MHLSSRSAQMLRSRTLNEKYRNFKDEEEKEEEDEEEYEKEMKNANDQSNIERGLRREFRP